MKKYFNIIKNSKLFSNLDEGEIELLLNCLTTTTRDYKKGEFILNAGERVTAVGLVLSGEIQIINEDFWGNRSIISQFGSGGLFAESYACADSPITTVSVIAMKDTKVMYMDVKRILTACSSSCVFHARLIRNLVSQLAQKNVLLNGKIEHLSKRSTKEKLISYLSEQSKRTGSSEFDIPFNRQQLADYLCVDRSAMSNELCKLRDQDFLRFDKQHFVLIQK